MTKAIQYRGSSTAPNITRALLHKIRIEAEYSGYCYAMDRLNPTSDQLRDKSFSRGYSIGQTELAMIVAKAAVNTP